MNTHTHTHNKRQKKKKQGINVHIVSSSDYRPGNIEYDNQFRRGCFGFVEDEQCRAGNVNCPFVVANKLCQS